MRKILLGLLLSLIATAGHAAAYTFQSVGTIAGNGAGTALSPGMPGTCSDGNLLVLFTAARAASQTLTVTGWTEIASNTTNSSVKLLTRVRQSGDTSPSVDWSGADYATAQIACYSGDVYTDQATIVAHSATTNGNSNSFNYAALTISTADTLVLIAGKHSKTATSDGITIDAEAGFTELGENSANGAGTQTFVWDYVQQTTATNISAGSWDPSVAAYETAGWASLTVSLKTASASPPSFSVGPTVSAQDDNDYTLSYTPSAAATFYAVAVAKDSAAPTCTQIKAGQNGSGAAAIAAVNEAVTGADTTVLGGSLTRPVHDLHACLNNAGGDSAVSSLNDECLDAPSGKQIINCPAGLSSIGAGSPIETLNASIAPDIAAGDIAICDVATTPSAFALTVGVDGQFSYSGDGSRQYANCTFYDLSASAIHADDLDWWANNLTPLPPEPDSIVFRWTSGQAITPIDLSAYCIDPESDALVATQVSGLAAGLSITNSVVSGTPTTPGISTLILRCTDITGASVDWQ